MRERQETGLHLLRAPCLSFCLPGAPSCKGECGMLCWAGLHTVFVEDGAICVSGGPIPPSKVIAHRGCLSELGVEQYPRLACMRCLPMAQQSPGQEPSASCISKVVQTME